MFNIYSFNKNQLFINLISSKKRLALLKTTKTVLLKNNFKSLEQFVFHSYLIFKASFIRKVLGLPSLKIRTRSKKKEFKNSFISRFFLECAYPVNNKYRLSEFYNIVWFIFFTYEWYITFFYNNRLKRRNHRKNIHFSHKDLKYRKIITHGSRTKKSKKNVKKKKDSSKEFNIGFYYLDTIKFFRNYLYYRQ